MWTARVGLWPRLFLKRCPRWIPATGSPNVPHCIWTVAKPHQIVERPPASNLKTILLVDDADESRLTTKWFLASFGYAVESVRDAGEGLSLFDPKVHDVV